MARIRAAKELGDLKENADYTAAREEQSFLEGRIQALEARLRDAVIVEAPVEPAPAADIGSQVTVEIDGETETYTLVGSSESDPARVGMSSASPVGGRCSGATRPATRSIGRDAARPASRYRVGRGRVARGRCGAVSGALGRSTSLCSTAYSAACVRDASPSLPRMFET